MSDLVCSVCQQPKAQYTERQSKLIPAKLILCNSCLKGDFEPRFAIVLTAVQQGPEAVESYIKGHRYVGDEISLKDILIEKPSIYGK